MVILAIDDDPETRSILTAALKSKFQVVTEESGARAIIVAEDCRPQIILLDLHMPNVDGFEVLAQFKDHPTFSKVPVICLSDKSDEENRNHAYSIGAVGFLVKPVDAETLAKDVEHLVAKMNTHVTSVDHSKKVFIGHNANAEAEKIKTTLTAALAQNELVIMLSFLDPRSLFTERENDLLRANKLFFLQIKPSLIARLPYLQKIESVVDDIRSLTGNQSEGAKLMIDGIERLFDLHDREQSLRVSQALEEALSRHFARVEYFCSYPRRDQPTIDSLNEIATVLVGARGAVAA